jgi:glyoxylase I family protein
MNGSGRDQVLRPKEKRMDRQRIGSGSSFEAQIGYSRAIVAGDWVFVSGTTGFDYSTMTIADDLVAQTEQCFRNIEAALAQAGAGLRDVVRVTYVLPEGSQFEQCWPVLRQYFGQVRPAAMMISAGLADPRMKIEIEVTALKQAAARAAPAPIQLSEIDHLVLRVVDLDATLAFYCGVLGCSVERREDAIGLVQLRAGRSLVDLVPVDGKLGRAGGAAPGREGRNLDHFCFRVEPFDEAAIRGQLAAHGVAAGPTEPRVGAQGEGPSIYITDPEGNVVELKGPPDAGSRASPR